MIGRYVDLKPAGRNWKGLCPFHEERTPSFNVNIDRQIFHCF
ncbi:CHC2 zinc finger domain-containing protein, partial [Myxococcota bacterium]|nr:CHC2 zinc finger domain-containing protein [Myxococcota bacterium]